jgi:HD-like signal output (HDOD) protein
MVQAHPPLFKQILRQLEEEQQGIGTQAAEAVCADGLMHTEVGAQLDEMWGFEPELIQMLRLHHAGAEGGHFSFLIGIADIIGQAIFPFPKQRQSALTRVFESGSVDELATLLPQTFYEHDLLTPEQFLRLGRMISPVVKNLTAERSKAI